MFAFKNLCFVLKLPVPKIHISYFLKRNSYFKFEGFFSLKKFDTFFENFLLHHAVILKDDFFSFRTISIREFQLLFLKNCFVNLQNYG
jgi:hypothetical protein